MGITNISIPDIAKALAIGQSRFTKNSSHIIFPKYNLSLPPNNSGITNSPTKAAVHLTKKGSLDKLTPQDGPIKITSVKLCHR